MPKILSSPQMLQATDVFKPKQEPTLYRDGIPVPKDVRRLSPGEVTQQAINALSTLYTGKDPNKLGLTKGSAMLLALAERAQDGDIDAIETLLNRIMGKPTQQINTVNVAVTMKEFLDGLNRTDPGSAPAITPLSD